MSIFESFESTLARSVVNGPLSPTTVPDAVAADECESLENEVE
jgi:hypothetical protein